MAEHFKIVFEGHLRTGVDLETARLNLAQLFKSDVSNMDRLFTGKPVTVKRSLTQDDAQRYLKALNDAGVEARIEPEQPVTWTLEEVTAPEPQKPAVESSASPYAPPRAAMAQDWPAVGELKVFTLQGRIGRLRYLAWSVPGSEHEVITDYAYMLRHLDGRVELAQDRHIAAFLATQNRRLERRVANDLSSISEEEGPDRYSVAAFIANLQALYYPAPLPNLGSAIARYLKPLIVEIRSTVRRSVVEQSLDAMATSGDLQPLTGALDVRQILALDQQEYEQAVVEYRQLNEYITHFGVDAPRNRALAIKRGFEVARLASLSVAFMTFFYFAMVAML